MLYCAERLVLLIQSLTSGLITFKNLFRFYFLAGERAFCELPIAIFKLCLEVTA
jgi:hypothetical protein